MRIVISLLVFIFAFNQIAFGISTSERENIFRMKLGDVLDTRREVEQKVKAAIQNKKSSEIPKSIRKADDALRQEVKKAEKALDKAANAEELRIGKSASTSHVESLIYDIRYRAEHEKKYIFEKAQEARESVERIAKEEAANTDNDKVIQLVNAAYEQLHIDEAKRQEGQSKGCGEN